MKVLVVGYGLEPPMLGGAVAIQREMIDGFTRRGVEIAVFQAGRYTLTGRAALVRHTRGGLDLFELLNSPNWPGKRDPTSQVSNAIIEKFTGAVLDSVRPDLVHVHELTFHCARVISLIRRRGIPIVKTIHNFWDLCPQRDLLFNGKEVCRDFLGGDRCVGCSYLHAARPLRVALGQLAGRLPKRELIRSGYKRLQTKLAPFLARPRPRSGAAPGTSDPGAGKSYASRREAFVAELNAASALHVYSRRSGEILQEHGVQRERIHYIPVSTRSVDAIRPRSLHDGQRPIRFGYRGGLAPNKGVHTLIEAFRTLDQKAAALRIYGTGHSSYVSELHSSASGYNIEFCGSYNPTQLSSINSGIDVGVVPSAAEELFGLVGVEFLNARVPVIGSGHGGITEYVTDGSNGFLFQPNDAADLGRKMKRFLDDPALVRQMQSRIQSWSSASQMCDGLFELCRDAVNQRL